jgi:hypothetical protein
MQSWKWGDNDPEQWFANHGWGSVAVEQVGGPTANFGRWKEPIPPRVAAGEPGACHSALFPAGQRAMEGCRHAGQEGCTW